MSDEKPLRESLRTLTQDVADTVAYLRELGVEGLPVSANLLSNVETPATTPQTPRVAPPVYVAPTLPPALERNARAESVAVKTSSRTPLPPPPPSSSRRAGSKQTNRVNESIMAKKPVRKPSPDPPAPRETLFGDITPKDELSLGRPGETFSDIRADIGDCVRCPLHEGRTKIVHTEGDQTARLMFVGEAPGADEDASGRPFVGRAGQLLNKIIEAIGVKREDVLIGNVNRCRPPANRTPTLEEAATCKPFLLREINIARPDVIVVMGNTAMRNLLDIKEGITKLRGTFQDYKGIKVMPTFHPAYLLRDPSKKREVWDDMKKVRDYLNETKK